VGSSAEPGYGHGVTVAHLRVGDLKVPMLRLSVALGLIPSLASAAPMQLVQQGRLLDAGGQPVNGAQTLVFRIEDAGGTARFTETLSNVPVTDGYYGVILGGASTPLDTGVFLSHGAMTLEIDLGAATLGTLAMGGYPVMVAQQSLLATQATLVSVQGTATATQTSVATLQSSVTSLQATVASLQTTLQGLSGANGRYSETCADWSSLGWVSQSECFKDGRWHRVFHGGGPAFGTIAELKAHIDAGASVKVTTGAQPAMFECVSISYQNRSWGNGSDGVVCQGTTTSHPGPHNQNVSGAYWSTYDQWSTGAMWYTERSGSGALFTGQWHGDSASKWWIRY
jgi:hypothetical protein